MSTTHVADQQVAGVTDVGTVRLPNGRTQVTMLVDLTEIVQVTVGSRRRAGLVEPLYSFTVNGVRVADNVAWHDTPEHLRRPLAAAMLATDDRPMLVA